MEMKWFQGSIADAVATVKTNKAVFVVYSEGTDELSTTMTAALAKSHISGQLQAESFVPIKLEGGSNAFQQFAQIYKFVPVPSVFFINTSGVPIEVVADGATEDIICTKLQSAITKSLASLSSGSSASVITPAVLPSPPSTPNVPAQERYVSPASSSTVSTDVTLQPSTPLTTVNNEPAPSTSDNAKNTADPPVSASPQKSLDEKVKHAKELLEKKKAETEAEEQRKEKERELERRRTAHEIALARKVQQERELKEMMEERKRLKKEDADAKRKILEKIAEDRAERAARLATNEQSPQEQSIPSTSTAPTVAPSPPQSNMNTARLQFKLPNGETKSHSFPADTTLSQVRQFIDNNIVIPFSEYQLATAFPRREFTRSDNDLDLRSLQLVPSAVILIVPMHRSSLVPIGPGWSTAFIKLFWDAMSPLYSVLRYLRGMIFGGGRQPGESTSTTAQQTPQQSQPPTRPTPYQRERATGIRKRGNVHSLSNRDDDANDDNNTWNGNSTQQM